MLQQRQSYTGYTPNSLAPHLVGQGLLKQGVDMDDTNSRGRPLSGQPMYISQPSPVLADRFIQDMSQNFVFGLD